MSSTHPVIGITIGDPAGIGPEIALKACQNRELLGKARPLVIGSGKVLEAAAGFCGLSIQMHRISHPSQGKYRAFVLDVLDMDNINVETLRIGQVQPACGKAAFAYIERSIECALRHEIDAVATGPINKESLKAAGIEYIGHTEIFAGLTGTLDPLTMFQVEMMRIFFLTRHLSLRRAIDSITKERVLDYILRCIEALRTLGEGKKPFAVAGLNPHCGEHGLFGDEEVHHIIPAVEEAQRMGYHVEGPIGADSVFHRALEGIYGGVLSLYHDQGHIAAKTFNFGKTVSVTLGLPILRTSVDHGTAFDIAGTGRASPISMIEAVMVAAEYAHRYNGDCISHRSVSPPVL
jgi:4-hydroxythreonine-4-phosphate dehydrogenase